MSIVLAVLAQAAAADACPRLEGVWALAGGERIMVLEQDGCRLRGTVAEPGDNMLHVRGFWTGGRWTMAATRIAAAGCATTAWGAIRAGASDTMLVDVAGSDGLCGPEGRPGTGPVRFSATMTYRRVAPAETAR
jgi:hypothetical protein